MALTFDIRHEAGLCSKFTAVSLLGFVVDIAALKIGLALGLSPAAARLISLILAMQVTFTINGLVVFRCLDARRLPRQWLGYMGSNGFGNLCNYLIFLALIGSRLPIVSNKLCALALGAFTAWMINFLGARLLAFGEHGLTASLIARRRICATCEQEAATPTAAPVAPAPSALVRR